MANHILSYMHNVSWQENTNLRFTGAKGKMVGHFGTKICKAGMAGSA